MPFKDAATAREYHRKRASAARGGRLSPHEALRAILEILEGGDIWDFDACLEIRTLARKGLGDE